MNTHKKTVRDVEVRGKKVLLRCDFNVPQDKETGAITSDKRIVAAPHPVSAGEWGGGHRLLPPGQAQERPRPQAEPSPGGEAPQRAAGPGSDLRP